MKKYDVCITETLQRYVGVEAETMADAIAIVSDQYRAADIVLDSSDHVKTDFSAEICAD